MSIKNLIPSLKRNRENIPVRHPDYDPFRDFQRDMNRLFDDFFDDFPLARRAGDTEMVSAGFLPRIDVSETDKEVKISAELPGLDEKDIAVEINDEAVIIRGEKKEEKEEKGKDWHIREQSFGSFHRVIDLPARVNGDKAAAKFKKGVLSITMPKLEEENAKRKTITIESE